jgi:hypothetical protein
MFFLTEHSHERFCSKGEDVIVLSDFVSVPAGTRGKVVEIYGGGIMVEWVGLPEKYAGLRDGFGRDELFHLRFGTENCPPFDNN